jgi:outer membrane immunogenic protein
MRRLLIGLMLSTASLSIVSVGVSAPALSDGYDRPYAQPYAAAAPFSWLGLYGGLHVGGAWANTTATDTGGVNIINDYWSAAPSGVVAGAQLGYNWRTGPVLYGLEGDLGYLGLAGNATTSYIPLGYDTSTNTDTGFYMTARGRLGVIINQYLLYATGGYFGADTTVSIYGACTSLLACGAPTVQGSNSSFRNGWTIGGGLEAEMGGNWTAKLEYLYYDLGSTTVTTTVGGIDTWTLDTSGSLVRAGLNFRFGGLSY